MSQPYRPPRPVTGIALLFLLLLSVLTITKYKTGYWGTLWEVKTNSAEVQTHVEYEITRQRNQVEDNVNVG
jgi:hypothetical protein